MSIEELGFLSPTITDWIGKHRSENPKWFRLAELVNGVAQRQVLLLDVPASDNRLVVLALLFLRGLTNFQGAVLLAERGLTTESADPRAMLFRECFSDGRNS